MVLVHDRTDKSSECALQIFDVSSKYLLRFQVIEPTRFCDRQMDARGKTIVRGHLESS